MTRVLSCIDAFLSNRKGTDLRPRRSTDWQLPFDFFSAPLWASTVPTLSGQCRVFIGKNSKNLIQPRDLENCPDTRGKTAQGELTAVRLHPLQRFDEERQP